MPERTQLNDEALVERGQARAELHRLLREKRVVVTAGSGGVGKTTTAAALAMQAAMEGKKVLCMTIDPARRLANSLGLSEMTLDKQTVPAELFAAQGLELKGELCAMMVDTKRTFDELVEQHASTPERRDQILENPIYKFMAESMAGTQEYMAMEKLHAVRQDSYWDLILLDTPPTANALDFLEAPERMVGAVDSPAMRWFIEAFQGAGKFSLGMLGKGAGMLLRAVGKFTGKQLLEEIAAFLVGIQDLFGGFRERASEVSGALRSDDVAFVLVTSPAPAAVDEALFFSEKLSEADMKLGAVVINGVHEAPAAIRPTDALAAELGPHFPGHDAKKLLQAMHQSLEDERVRGLSDRNEASRLHGAVGSSTPVVEVPELETDVHDLRTLSMIASHLVNASV